MTAHGGHRVLVGTDRRVLERLTPLDVSNLRIERRGLPMNVAALAVLEGRVLLGASGQLALEAIRARIEHRLHLAPRLRQRLYRPSLGLGTPVWVDDASFDISRHVHLDTSFARELGEPPEPYEVLHAAMAGDYQCFAREDSVEETWRIVQPLLGHPPDVRPYPRGVLGTRGGGNPALRPPALAAAAAAREGLSP